MVQKHHRQAPDALALLNLWRFFQTFKAEVEGFPRNADGFQVLGAMIRACDAGQSF